jgi:hypothetical protein
MTYVYRDVGHPQGDKATGREDDLGEVPSGGGHVRVVPRPRPRDRSSSREWNESGDRAAKVRLGRQSGGAVASSSQVGHIRGREKTRAVKRKKNTRWCEGARVPSLQPDDRELVVGP